MQAGDPQGGYNTPGLDRERVFGGSGFMLPEDFESGGDAEDRLGACGGQLGPKA